MFHLQRILTLLLSLLLLPEYLAASLTIQKTMRNSYIRGEKVEWTANADPHAEVVFSVSGIKLFTVKTDADGVARLTLDTAALQEGRYQLKVRMKDAVDTATFHIGPVISHDGIPLYRWGHVGTETDLKWYLGKGFSGGTTGVMRDVETADSDIYIARMELLNRAAREGFTIGFYLHPLWSKKVVEQEEARVLMRNGVRVPATKAWPVDPLTKPALAYAREVTASFLQHYADHPAIGYVMLSSEQRPLPGITPELQAMAQKELPFDFAEILEKKSAATFRQIAPELRGVIEDNQPDYLGRRWFHERGHGTALLNEEIANAIRKKRPDLKFSHEPWRNAPTQGTAKGLDFAASWTYAYSDLKRLMFARYLRAPGRDENQKIQPILTIYAYASMVLTEGTAGEDLTLDTSGKAPFFTASPDYVREALWIYLSQRPDELSIYWASRLSPERPGLDPHLFSPDSFSVIEEFSNRILKPYGPALKAGRPAKARVGLLASAVAAWFRDTPVGYNINEATLPYAALLVMNDVPFEVLLDNDIKDETLSQYQALVIPLADTLTQGMVDTITRFAARGGRVIVDQNCSALNAGNTIHTAFDFEPLLRQSGKAWEEGETVVTAEEAREMMEGYAARLAPHVSAYRGEVTSPSKRVIINSVESNGAAIHFVINDDRTYGPRFGDHKLHFENGVRQQAEIQFTTDRYPVLYDLQTRKQIQEPVVNGTMTWKPWLPAAGGRMVFALPEAVGKLTIEAPAVFKAGEPRTVRLRLFGASGKPMTHAHPVHFSMTTADGTESGWSRYLAIVNGEATVPFTPAWNDTPGTWLLKATDLVTGKTTLLKAEMTSD